MKIRNWLAAAGLVVGGMAWLAWPGIDAGGRSRGRAQHRQRQRRRHRRRIPVRGSDDNTKVCILGTVHGFIVPGEADNFGGFDPGVLYRFAIENTGDAKPDAFIDITFSERTNATDPQTASIRLPGVKGKAASFTAPTTPPTTAATADPQTVTTDPASGVSFFAGEVDDPFFFDIPGVQPVRRLGAGGHARRDPAHPRPRFVRRVQHPGHRAEHPAPT